MVQRNYSGSERSSIGKDEELSKDVVLGKVYFWFGSVRQGGWASMLFLGWGILKPPRHP